MINKNTSPTVLLVDEQKNDFCSTRYWLNNNGYKVREVTNVYDAFEEVTDFTQDWHPSLLVINTSLSRQDYQFVVDSLHEFTKLQKISIVAIANRKTNDIVHNQSVVQIENIEMLKPLVKELSSVGAAHKRVAAATA